MLKAVIFDLDGTIGDTLPLCIAAFRKSVERISGRRLSDDEIIATFGPSEEGTILSLVPDHYEEGVESYLKHYEQMHDMCAQPFEGMKAVIDRLKSKGLIVAMVTGKGRISCEITLRKYGMENSFDAVETGSPRGQVKTEGIIAVLERFGLEPGQALYVGDAPSDITSSRRAGVKVVSAAWADTADPGELIDLCPDEIFYSVDRFRLYLEETIGR